MTTDVDHALELITAALAGMAVLIVLLVLAERVILRPQAPRAAAQPVATQPVSAPPAAPVLSAAEPVEAGAGAPV